MLLNLSPDHSPPSDWVTRWARQRPAGTALDLACGRGRHARWLAEQGWQVTAVDRQADCVASLPAGVKALVADLEDGPWPLAGRRFDLVVVTHYLWRPRFADLLGCVAEGGWLIYETFSHHQARLGRPSRAEFLLQPAELLRLAAPLEVLGFEDGLLGSPPRAIQRLCARREAPGAPPVHLPSAGDLGPSALG